VKVVEKPMQVVFIFMFVINAEENSVITVLMMAKNVLYASKVS